ncbi:hypothetical protein TcCL_Unassigned06383, partial [Trypanosoma cruzi]
PAVLIFWLVGTLFEKCNSPLNVSFAIPAMRFQYECIPFTGRLLGDRECVLMPVPVMFDVLCGDISRGSVIPDDGPRKYGAPPRLRRIVKRGLSRIVIFRLIILFLSFY